MNIPIWILVVGVPGLFVAGFLLCGVFAVGKVADYQPLAEALSKRLREAHAAHSRCADALQTVRGKLDAIQDLANSPQTIRKKDIRAVLGGDA